MFKAKGIEFTTEDGNKGVVTCNAGQDMLALNGLTKATPYIASFDDEEHAAPYIAQMALMMIESGNKVTFKVVDLEFGGDKPQDN